MARRRDLLFGLRYCGNTNTMEVHDLDNEQTQCQIDKIIEGDHATPFNELSDADEYDNCLHCITVPAQIDENQV